MITRNIFGISVRPAALFMVGTLLLINSGCTSILKPEAIPAPSPQDLQKIERAQDLLSLGHQTALLESNQIFRDLTEVPALMDEASEGFIKTGMLLHLRQKEMGAVKAEGLTLLRESSALFPRFKEFGYLFDLLERIPASTKGIIGKTRADDPNVEDYLDWLRTDFPPLREKLRLRAESDEFHAYIYISFVEAFNFKFPNLPAVSELGTTFPDSNLVAYKLATFPKAKAVELAGLLSRDPDFAEAHFFLGDQAFGEGRVLTAEKHFKETLAAFPDSSSTLISLARIHHYLEEIEKSLAFDELALELAPGYRDALLGKAMCLCYLGRFEESIKVLEEMLRLGFYMIGEARYWLARNLNELGRLEEARANIEEARKYIIGQYEIPALDGQIAYKQKRPDEAEKYLKEALSLYNSDCESAYTLGQLYTDKGQWLDSALSFAQGSGCNEVMEKALEDKIREIEKADLDSNRREKLLYIKKSQLLHHRRTKAGCDFNAAASYYNAGKIESALEMARKAALYPLFKDKAQELILRIEREKSR